MFLLFTTAPLAFSTAPGLLEVLSGFLSKSPLSLDVTQLALRVEKSLDLLVFPWRKK